MKIIPYGKQFINNDDVKAVSRALKNKIPRPFIFGPVQFYNLNKTEEQVAFDPEA